MGMYEVNCRGCGQLFHWFSGSGPAQLCPGCSVAEPSEPSSSGSAGGAGSIASSTGSQGGGQAGCSIQWFICQKCGNNSPHQCTCHLQVGRAGGGVGCATPLLVSKGWECPRCTRCLSPLVSECPHCQPAVVTVQQQQPNLQGYPYTGSQGSGGTSGCASPT